MYVDYYELKTKPFQITSDPKFLWLGNKHKEALATLRYGIMDNRGFLLLTGEVGTGKTILINRLITMLEIGTVVATIPDPDLVSMDFYNLLAEGFQMNRTFDSKGAFLIHLRDFLHKSHADQKQVLLVIDESQRLNHQLMEDIRVLSNIELHDQKLINIFFVGQQEFNNILMTPQNRALAQRITIRYHIEPLNLEETEKYIYHRLKLAGSKRKLFKPETLPEIFSFSGGIPRLINIICDHALLTGFSQGKKEIDLTIIQECAQDLRIPAKKLDTDNVSYATAKQVDAKEGKSPPPKASQPPSESPTASPQPTSTKEAVRPQSSFAWKTIFLIFVVILIGLVAFTITQLNQNQGPRWDVEELTPKKYLSTLEREKELLASRLENGTTEEQVADSQPEVVESQKKNSAPASALAIQAQTTSPSPLNEGEIAPLPLIKEKIVIPFSLNSNELEPESYPVLNRIAGYLKDHPEEIAYVRGFTDSSGSSSYNESVSRFRANAVKSFLLGQGAPPENIRVFAMGASSPIASNATQDGRTQNRRVEIEFPPTSAISQ